ncbi:MAG: hypothetical protein R3F56_08845 [Planctomycetota bacterium]
MVDPARLCLPCLLAMWPAVLSVKGASQRLFDRSTAGPPLVRQASIDGTAGPFVFVPNHGQWPDHVRFATTAGLTTFVFEANGWWMNFEAERELPPARRDPALAGGAALHMTFVGCEPSQATGDDRLPGVYNYFLGSDPDRWHTSVPRYAAVVYHDLYPGIDVRAYSARGRFEYDLVVADGVPAATVEVKVEGADAMRLDDDGALVFSTAVGEVRQEPPVAYVVDPSGGRQPVACAHRLLGSDRFAFTVDLGTLRGTLVIDPGLVYGTYVGTYSEEWANAVVASAAGTITVAGATNSADFPTTPGAWYRTWRPGYDGVITMLDPARVGAEQLVYSTFFGGVGWDEVIAMTVDGAGILTLTGYTDSSDFPTTADAWDRHLHGTSLLDVFVTRFDPARPQIEQLVYSTFLGGAGSDLVRAMEVDSAGVVTIAGDTSSNDFPTTPGAFDRSHATADSDSFVARLDPARVPAEQLRYGTYLGGALSDGANAVSVGPDGVITVGGATRSTDFPTTDGAFRRQAYDWSDTFAARLDPARTGTDQLVYGTYLGGVGIEFALAVASDDAGRLLVAGWTESADFPTTPTAFDRILRGRSNAFLVRLDPERSGAEQLSYATFLGGTWGDRINVLVPDPSGLLILAGSAGSSDFPTTRGATAPAGGGDVFVARIDIDAPPAAQLHYATALGGSLGEVLGSVAPGPRGTMLVAGRTWSTDFPTSPGAWDRSFNSGGPYNPDIFVAEIDMLPTGVDRFGDSSFGCAGRLAADASSMPFVGNADFRLTCSNAPSRAHGEVFLASAALSAPLRVLGVDLWIDPASDWLAIVPVQSNASGYATQPFPIPDDPVLTGVALYAQFCWFGATQPPPCPPQGFATSDPLRVTIQP